jgi:hypothetical protein
MNKIKILIGDVAFLADVILTHPCIELRAKDVSLQEIQRGIREDLRCRESRLGYFWDSYNTELHEEIISVLKDANGFFAEEYEWDNLNPADVLLLYRVQNGKVYWLKVYVEEVNLRA